MSSDGDSENLSGNPGASTDLEEERAQALKRNKQMLAALGVSIAAQSLKAAKQQEPANKRQKRESLPATQTRRSSRQHAQAARVRIQQTAKVKSDSSEDEKESASSSDADADARDAAGDAHASPGPSNASKARPRGRPRGGGATETQVQRRSGGGSQQQRGRKAARKAASSSGPGEANEAGREGARGPSITGKSRANRLCDDGDGEEAADAEDGDDNSSSSSSSDSDSDVDLVQDDEDDDDDEEEVESEESEEADSDSSGRKGRRGRRGRPAGAAAPSKGNSGGRSSTRSRAGAGASNRGRGRAAADGSGPSGSARPQSAAKPPARRAARAPRRQPAAAAAAVNASVARKPGDEYGMPPEDELLALWNMLEPEDNLVSPAGVLRVAAQLGLHDFNSTLLEHMMDFAREKVPGLTTSTPGLTLQQFTALVSALYDPQLPGPNEPNRAEGPAPSDLGQSESQQRNQGVDAAGAQQQGGQDSSVLTGLPSELALAEE